MKIWIVNYYTVPPAFARNERHLKFAHYLKEAGYDVTIFCAQCKRAGEQGVPAKGQLFKETTYGEHKFVHVKVKPYKGNGHARMISIFQFAWLIFVHRKRFERPDVILHNIHEPFDYPISWCAKKLKAKYIVEDWDLWTQSFVDTGLVKKGSIASKILYRLNRKLFAKADRIVFTMEGGPDYIRQRGWDKESGGPIDMSKVYYINNGLDLADFERNKVEHVRKDDDLTDESIRKVVYLGSINLANNIKQLIDAANLLKDHKNIKFLIYGDGADRKELEEYCEANQIDNVVFKEKSIPLHDVSYVISQARVNMLNYYKNFGLYGVSSGKLFQYLAAGKPICCNVNMKSYDLITRYNLGISKEYCTAQEYADAILSLLDMPQDEYEAMCGRVREVAIQFDYKVLSNKLIEILKTL